MRRWNQFLVVVLTCLMACENESISGEVDNKRTDSPDRIRLLRDAQGIPHVFASTDAGAVYGAGYAAAEDRLFQMHLARMKYQGRLAEIFGREVESSDGTFKSVIDMDRKYRTYGLKTHMERVIENLDSSTVALLQAYSDGVNDSVAAQGVLPVVFADVRVTTFELWTPVDSLLAYLITAAPFSRDALGEMKSGNRFERDVADACGRTPTDSCLDEIRADWLYPIIDDDAAIIPEPETTASRSPGLTRIPENKKASHAWAISGDHTTTGKPYLNGRPQILLRERAFYQSHIKGETFDVQGIGVPGLFGYMIGMTQHTAWSITSMNADNADLFRLREGSSPDSYLVNNQEIELEIHSETIHIRDEPPEVLTIRSSRFGVIVNELLEPADVEPGVLYAQRYMVTEMPNGRLHPIQGLLGMMRADHWSEFRDEGMNYWSYPNANLIYADDGVLGPTARKQGNICYRPATVLPIRSENAPLYGLIPQVADQWDDNWTGFMGVETIPEICNPAKGFLVSANHLPVGSWWGHYGLGGSGDTYRSWHIKREMVDMIKRGPIPPVSNEAFHRDSGQPRLLAMRDLANWYKGTPEQGTLTARAKLALQILNRWNGESRLDVPEFRIASWEGGGSYPIDANFRRFLKEEYGDRESSIVLFFKRFNKDPMSALMFNDSAGNMVDLRRDGFEFVNATLVDFWNEATNSASPPDCADAPVACLLPHTTSDTVAYGTYLGTFKEWPGGRSYDIDVEHHGATSLATVWSVRGNAYSQVVQLGEPNATQTLVGPGNSNNPESPYFDNTVDDWVNGTHYRTPMDRGQLETEAVSAQDLRYSN
jgi:penicillin amidase